jgi:hypothetical protein
MLGLVRHLRGHPLLIADLVSVHLLKLAGQRAGLLVSEYPGLFSDEQLAELSAAFAAMTDTSLLLRLDGERAFFQDMLQRIYTDDGRGDGRMTRRGLLELRTVMHFQTEPELSLGDHLSGPLILLGAPSRRELETTWERMAWRVKTDAAVYPYQRRSYDGEVEMLEMRRRARPGYELITSLMPAFAHAFARIDEARQARDAALIALALERSRLRLGQYPADLVALTPELLERIPIDIYAFDNGTLRYMLRGGRPLVYSVGRNGEDDGADFTIPEDDPEYIPWRNQPRDILLWPPPPPRGEPVGVLSGTTRLCTHSVRDTGCYLKNAAVWRACASEIRGRCLSFNGCGRFRGSHHATAIDSSLVHSSPATTRHSKASAMYDTVFPSG